MVIVECVILYIISKISHNVDGMVGLQNCLDKLKSEPGPCTDTCQPSSDDRNQVVSIKVEDIADIKVEEDPELAASTGIKTERAVSCVYVLYQGLCTLDQ
jgi:hypothetical protein